MKDGDLFTSAVLNAHFALAEGQANAPTEDHVTGLVAEQLPRTIDDRTFGYGQAIAPANADTTETYNTFQADSSAGGTLPFDYQRFGVTGSNAPFGAPASNDTGWRILAKAQSTTDSARALFDPPLDMTAVAAARFTLQCDVRDALTTGTHKHRNAALLGVAVQDGAGNRYVFPESVVWFSLQAVERGPISICFFYVPELHQTAAEAEGVDMEDIVAAYGLISTRERIDADTQHFDPEVAAFAFFALPMYGGAL